MDLPQNNVTIIGQSAFYNCDSLTNISLPDSLEVIYDYAFYDCDALESIVIPDSVELIWTEVFYGCENLKTVDFGNGLNYIFDSAFRLCPSLTEIVFPKSLTEIRDYAFAECTSLSKVTIYPNTTSISSNAFSYPARTTIYGYKGTYAEEYANSRGMPFVPLDKLTAEDITIEISDHEYTGKQITPVVELYDDGYKLTEGVEYPQLARQSEQQARTGRRRDHQKDREQPIPC